MQGLQDYRCLKSTQRIFLGNFTFEPLLNPFKYFHITSGNEQKFSQIELEVSSNYGSDITCMYRFGIHGHINAIPLESCDPSKDN